MKKQIKYRHRKEIKEERNFKLEFKNISDAEAFSVSSQISFIACIYSSKSLTLGNFIGSIWPLTPCHMHLIHTDVLYSI